MQADKRIQMYKKPWIRKGQRRLNVYVSDKQYALIEHYCKQYDMDITNVVKMALDGLTKTL